MQPNLRLPNLFSGLESWQENPAGQNGSLIAVAWDMHLYTCGVYYLSGFQIRSSLFMTQKCSSKVRFLHQKSHHSTAQDIAWTVKRSHFWRFLATLLGAECPHDSDWGLSSIEYSAEKFLALHVRIYVQILTFLLSAFPCCSSTDGKRESLEWKRTITISDLLI